MNPAVLLLPLAALLAACHSDPTVEASNATVADVANQVADASSGDPQSIRPGLWSSTVTVEEIAAPGIPPELVQRMKDTVGSGQAHQTCLTEEQVKKPDADFFGGAKGQCRYDHFRMGGGTIDATMRCSQQGASQVMELDGTYSPESYRMQMTTQMEGVGPAGGMSMKMRVESNRIGECPGKTA